MSARGGDASSLGPDGKAITDLDAIAPKPFVDAFFARFMQQPENKVRLALGVRMPRARARTC